MVLVLILGLVWPQLANATLIALNIDGTSTPSDGTEDILDGGGSVTLYCIGDTSSGLEYLDMLKGKATIIRDGSGISPAAGDEAQIYPPPGDPHSPTHYSFELTTADSGGNYPGGVLFTFTITEDGGNINDTFAVDLLSGVSYAVIDTITFTIVPEPMTIVLLSLGGLLLRRRR